MARMDATRRRRWLDPFISILLGAGAFALYASTLAPTVLSGDGGEFQFVPYLAGIAHPTGYPLYTVLGWLWSHLLPIGDVAYRLNLFSALWAALAVALVYPTARSFIRQALADTAPWIHRLLAVWASVTFAATPTLWSQSLIAEVYGLHILLVVLVVYFVLTWGDKTTQGATAHGFLLGAALVYGLGLAHHATTLLLAPAILIYVLLIDRQIFRNWRLLLQAMALLMLPLLLYLYLPLRAPHTPYLRLDLTADTQLVLYENTLGNLIQFVSGGPFGGAVDLSVDLGTRLAEAWGFLLGEVGWFGVLLASVGLVHLTFRRHWALIALTGLAYLVSVAFNLVYTIGDIYVMYIPSYLIITLWMAVGVGTLAYPLRNRPALSILTAALFFVLPLWMAFGNYATVDQSENRRARERWEAILSEPLPSGAILVSNDRNDIMPMWYLQYAEDQRPDLLGLFPLITSEYPTLGHILDLAVSSGRPVYLIKEMPGIGLKIDVESEGQLWHVQGPAAGQEPAYPQGVRLADAVALLGTDRNPHSPRPGQTLQVSLYWQPLRPLEQEYHSYVHMIDEQGNTIVQSDQQPGGLYYPSTVWQPGERLRDDHFLAVPDDAPPGVYRLLAGMYALPGDGSLEPLGDPVEIGLVGVKTDGSHDTGQVDYPVDANFGDQIALRGYSADLEETALEVALLWQALQAPNADYTVFVHLLNAGGETIAQHDGQPQDDAYPTSVWDRDEMVADTHTLTLPPNLPPGTYRLQIGLYRPETGERLSVVDNGDSVTLEFTLGG
jgi:hypothetical protein